MTGERDEGDKTRSKARTDKNRIYTLKQAIMIRQHYINKTNKNTSVRGRGDDDKTNLMNHTKY